MTRIDDDADEPAEFPVLLWIPAVCWMLHGVGVLASSVIVTAIIFIEGDVGAMCFSVWLPIVPMLGWFILKFGRDILRGVPNSLPTVARGSFMATVVVPICIIIVDADAALLAVCEGAMFLLCGVLGNHYTNDWFVWIVSQPVREDDDEPGA